MEIKLENAISIRNWEFSDLTSLINNANNENISAFMRDAFPYPYTQTEGLKWLYEVANNENSTHFAICENDKAIGGIGIIIQDDVYRLTAEIGYWLGYSYWGKKIMTQAVNEFSQYCFNTYNIIRLEAKVYEPNIASQKVLQKCNYVQEGILKNNVIKNGKILNSLLFARLK